MFVAMPIAYMVRALAWVGLAYADSIAANGSAYLVILALFHYGTSFCFLWLVSVSIPGVPLWNGTPKPPRARR